MKSLSSRAAAAAGGVLLLTGLAGCGIRPTGVIDAGDPATGIAAGPQLYFTAGTRLQAAERTTGTLGSLQSALDALAGGPNSDERARGLTTQLPTTTMRVEADWARGGYAVQLTGDLSKLPDLGVGQIVCTVSAWQSAAHGNDLSAASVRVSDSNSRLGPYSCSHFSQ